MKPLALLFALAGLASALGGTSVVRTPPVGLLTVEASADSTSALSLPLESSPLFVGEISGVGKRTLSWKGAPYRARADYQQRPRFVRMTDGRSAGQSFRILSGRDHVLRVEVTGDLAERVDKGDHFEILDADTLASVFGADGRGLLTGGSAGESDNVRLLGRDGWRTYFHDGKKWRLAGDGSQASSNRVVIEPGQGFLVVRRSRSPLALQIVGDVPVNPVVTMPRGAAAALVGNPYPTSRRLSAVALGLRVDWASISVQGSEGWREYSLRRGIWIDPRGRDSRQGPEVPAGSAVLVERVAKP